MGSGVSEKKKKGVTVEGEGDKPADVAAPVVEAGKENAEGPTAKPEGKNASGVRVTIVAAPMMQAVQVPEELALLPVRGAVSFPGAVMPLTIGRPRSKKLLDE